MVFESGVLGRQSVLGAVMRGRERESSLSGIDKWDPKNWLAGSSCSALCCIIRQVSPHVLICGAMIQGYSLETQAK